MYTSKRIRRTNSKFFLRRGAFQRHNLTGECKERNLHYGMEGFRIQIYASSNRNAREESNKARAEFLTKFPEVFSCILYANPGYFKVRVGNFRTKTEAMSLFIKISKEFPDAYIVPDFINFPDPK